MFICYLLGFKTILSFSFLTIKPQTYNLMYFEHSILFSLVTHGNYIMSKVWSFFNLYLSNIFRTSTISLIPCIFIRCSIFSGWILLKPNFSQWCALKTNRPSIPSQWEMLYIPTASVLNFSIGWNLRELRTWSTA